MMETATEAFLASIYEEVEKVLFTQGYRRTKHQRRSDDFGYLYSVFETAERVVRFIWDGREGSLIFRIYNRRKWGQKLVKALIGGTPNDEKLWKECIVGRDELATLGERELTDKLLQTLRGE
ncbi:hypothetical protein [Cohnella thermotolerans]|uniref:hypothetical protein n=1 Tax=Cohnella thermotolerans TaxID=329858 RepID=UPI000404707E|nr:hypothetical protein [Cohnella thermotolerans]